MAYVRNDDQIRTAFPSFMRNDVNDVLRHIGKVEVWETPIEAYVAGEPLTMPHRIHGATRDPDNLSSDQQRTIYWCVFSRSTDGYIREEAIKYLVNVPESEWVIPYIFISLSDRVIEVTAAVTSKYQDGQVFMGFKNGNSNLYNQTLDRCISYWNEYYRTSYPRLEGYPPYKLVATLTK